VSDRALLGLNRRARAANAMFLLAAAGARLALLGGTGPRLARLVAAGRCVGEVNRRGEAAADAAGDAEVTNMDMREAPDRTLSAPNDLPRGSPVSMRSRTCG